MALHVSCDVLQMQLCHGQARFASLYCRCCTGVTTYGASPDLRDNVAISVLYEVSNSLSVRSLLKVSTCAVHQVGCDACMSCSDCVDAGCRSWSLSAYMLQVHLLSHCCIEWRQEGLRGTMPVPWMLFVLTARPDISVPRPFNVVLLVLWCCLSGGYRLNPCCLF